MVFTESMLNGYAQPLSETEDQRCKRAINMVRDALRNIGYSTPATAPDILVADSYAYTYEMRNAAGKKVRLLVQGSYANNTNVKQNSDVDIAVILESTFETNYRPGVTGERYGFTDSSETALSFKDAVEKILRDYFVTGVERKKTKSIALPLKTNPIYFPVFFDPDEVLFVFLEDLLRMIANAFCQMRGSWSNP